MSLPAAQPTGRAATADAAVEPPGSADHWGEAFRDDLAADVMFERRLLYKEVVIITIVGLLVLLREWLL